MLARRHAGLALVAVFVCGLAPPAFADGALGGLEAFGNFVESVLVLLALGIVALIVRAILVSRMRRADQRMEMAESPELPEARAMNERSRSESKR